VGKYGWDPARVKGAMINFARYFGRTTEVYYPRSVSVVIRYLPPDRYIVSEIPLVTVARGGGVGYTSTLDVSKNVAKKHKEATMATRVAKPAATKTRRAKPAPEPEPEELEEEELDEDPEDEADEDLEDEEQDEDEDAEEEDEEDEEEQDEEDDPDADAPDYTPYATKAITPTMSDFHEWLNDEVGDLSEMDTERIVALAGTLRMEFQRSQFCKDRRAERQAQRAKPAPAKSTAKTKAAPAKSAPAKSTAKAAPAKSAPAKPAARQTAASSKARPGTAPGKPAARAADRPAATRTRRRGASEPY
jgi:hypothetical protein